MLDGSTGSHRLPGAADAARFFLGGSIGQAPPPSVGSSSSHASWDMEGNPSQGSYYEQAPRGCASPESRCPGRQLKSRQRAQTWSSAGSSLRRAFHDSTWLDALRSTSKSRQAEDVPRRGRT